MIAREYVENMILETLSKRLVTDLSDDQIEKQFKTLIPVFDIVIQKVLRKTSIPQFTNEDLISFMYLKAHQVLRRQKYDQNKSAYSFFYVSFNNLVRDIIRRQNSIKVSKMEHDLLDYVVNCHFEEVRYSMNNICVI